MPEAILRRPVYLGIDVGSTSAKVSAFDAAGACIATAGLGAGYVIYRPAPGYAEQDASAWSEAVDESVGRVADQADLSSVEAIGVTGQVDTHVLVDEDFRPLRSALLWQDIRSAGDAELLNQALGPAGRSQGWGVPDPLDASNPVPRALWFSRCDPSAWARSRWLLLPKDFIKGRLTGKATSDRYSSFKVASSGDGYVPGVDSALGLAERLPPLREPEDITGRSQHPWHGIPSGTPVATCTMDAFANMLGSGLKDTGDTMIVLGTSVIIGAVGSDQAASSGVIAFAPYRGRRVHAGPTQSGGASVSWWAQASGHQLGDVLRAADAAEPGAGGIVFAPHLLGERAPLWDSDVRAWFTGLHAGAGFAELSRAVLEGVAYSARELLAAVEASTGAPTRRIVVSGGGSRSDLWCQILADVIGRRVQRSNEADTAVLGAAALAACAHRGGDPWDMAHNLVRPGRDFRPVATLRCRYDQLFDAYCETYGSLRHVHRGLQGAGRQPPPPGTKS